MSVATVASAMMEHVSKKVMHWNVLSPGVNKFIKPKTDVVKGISRYFYRTPVVQHMGGVYAKVSANAGAAPLGTSPSITHLTFAYFYSLRMYRFTEEEIDITSSNVASVMDTLSETISNAMIDSAIDDNVCFHTNGSGFLTNSCSSITGTNTMVFAGATDTVGVRRLRIGQACDVWTLDGATKRAPATAQPLIISSIDYTTKTVVFDQNVTSLAATDRISFQDLDAYGPATLVTGASTWPGTAPDTTAAGLSGDSFRHGLYYAHDDTGATYYAGRQRSVLPQLKPVKYAAPTSGTALQFAHGQYIADAMFSKRQDEALYKGMIGLAPFAQRAQLFTQGVNLATRMFDGSQMGKSTDLMPSNNGPMDPFPYAGFTMYPDVLQADDRIDFINPGRNWFRTEVVPTDWWKSAKGDKFKEGRNSSGRPTMSLEFGIKAVYDLGCLDPGSEGYLESFAIPAVYQ